MARITNLTNIRATQWSGVFDVTLTVVHPGGRAKTFDYTYNPADTEQETRDITAWLKNKNIVPSRVAAPYVPPTPTVEQIKSEANRRIERAWPLWKQLNVMRSGDQAAINLMGADIDVLRQKSRGLEETLPHDYIDDKHWV